MKIKKLLFICLIFLFFIFLSNSVNAYVLKENGTEKYYLPDLPFDDSEEGVNRSVFLYDISNNLVYLLQNPRR